MLKNLFNIDEEVNLGKHNVIATKGDNGSVILRNEEPLDLDEHTMLDCIDYWAKKSRIR